MTERRAKGRSSSPRSGGGLGEARKLRRSRLLVYVMFAYGVALIVGTLALWYLLVPASPSSPSPVPCTLGALPPTTSRATASLAGQSSVFPPPANGTATPQTFDLWINTTAQLLPGTNVSFQVHDLVGNPVSSSCRLPIPASGWTSNVTSLTLDPQRSYEATFFGAPSPSYPRAGAFALMAWVNATNLPSAATLGSTHVFLTVE
ncbi:MAG: hypothetical protein KGJ23_14485 [Euryarchaeota archaeon]|nr:hypothetical protein [Euryarchaeota archaeon]MDE2046191.1 hypothetical protein [Thermoplasmata archaeon]